MHHSCSDSREGVIVSELDFRNSDSVVLIDNGDDSHLKKLSEGILSIEILRALRVVSNLLSNFTDHPSYIGNVISGQQNLSDGQLQVGKEAVPETNKSALTNCCQSL